MPALTSLLAVALSMPVSATKASVAKLEPILVANAAGSNLPVVISWVTAFLPALANSAGSIEPTCVPTNPAPALNTAPFNASIGSAPAATCKPKFKMPDPSAPAAAPVAPKALPIA